MTTPKRPFQPQKIQKAINRQSWIVLLVVLIGLAVDFLTKTPFTTSKNLLAGAVLAWIGQLIFAKIALSVTGAKNQRQIVHRMYQATMIKWMITFIGFATIFILLRPLMAAWVLIGFITLQISYIIINYRIKL